MAKRTTKTQTPHLEGDSCHAVYRELSQGLFSMETCQRWLSVGVQQDGVYPGTRIESEFDVYQGEHAFLFLLRLATGLESEIVGETDVFGQIKEAWRKFEALKSPLMSELAPWMRRLFEDTKEIRTVFLQNLGGTSYGSLLRKLIKERGGDQGPILILGAGQIAQSVAPFLLDYDLLLWNRNPERLEDFAQSLRSRVKPERLRAGGTSPVSVLENEIEGWNQAKAVVICTPLDPEADAKKVAWLEERNQTDMRVIHLGAMRETTSVWNSLPHFFCLDDLFELKKSMTHVRSLQVAQAERACEEQARQRYVNESRIKIRDSKVPFSVGAEFVGRTPGRMA